MKIVDKALVILLKISIAILVMSVIFVIWAEDPVNDSNGYKMIGSQLIISIILSIIIDSHKPPENVKPIKRRHIGQPPTDEEDEE